MPTSSPNVVLTVTTIVTRELGLADGAIGPDADLRDVEGADSVKVLRMVSKIEREYDIELDDEAVFSVSTIAEISAVVSRALAAEAA